MSRNRMQSLTVAGPAVADPGTAAPQDAGAVVMTVPEAGRKLGLSRNAAYEAAARGDIPTIRIGKLLKVPKVAFYRMLDETTINKARPI
jgi:excisionase family DNA binding protein